jgi:hypothetical protein
MIEQLLQLAVNGLIVGTILALTGVGASLVFGIQRVANFAHGEYLTFGAYAGLILNVYYHSDLITATIGAMAATALLALAIHFLILQPLRSRARCDVADHRGHRPHVARRRVHGAGPQIRQYAIDQTRVYDWSRAHRAGQAVAISWPRSWCRQWRTAADTRGKSMRASPTTAISPPFPDRRGSHRHLRGFSLARSLASAA